jgi:hypothetical protein
MGLAVDLGAQSTPVARMSEAKSGVGIAFIPDVASLVRATVLLVYRLNNCFSMSFIGRLSCGGGGGGSLCAGADGAGVGAVAGVPRL